MQKQRQALAQAEVKALRAQISPHFVYNALNTISSLIRTDPAHARELLQEFAEFTRYSFRTDGLFTTLADELTQHPPLPDHRTGPLRRRRSERPAAHRSGGPAGRPAVPGAPAAGRERRPARPGQEARRRHAHHHRRGQRQRGPDQRRGRRRRHGPRPLSTTSRTPTRPAPTSASATSTTACAPSSAPSTPWSWRRRPNAGTKVILQGAEVRTERAAEPQPGSAPGRADDGGAAGDPCLSQANLTLNLAPERADDPVVNEQPAFRPQRAGRELRASTNCRNNKHPSASASASSALQRDSPAASANPRNGQTAVQRAATAKVVISTTAHTLQLTHIQ